MTIKQATLDFFVQQFEEYSQHPSSRYANMPRITLTIVILGITVIAASAASAAEPSAAGSVRLIHAEGQGHSSDPAAVVGLDDQQVDDGFGVSDEPVAAPRDVGVVITDEGEGVADPAEDCPTPEEAVTTTTSLWLVSSRRLPTSCGCVDLDSPDLDASKVDGVGRAWPTDLGSFFDGLSPSRPLILHVHGNRISSSEALERGRFVHGKLARHLPKGGYDFAMFTWPSDKSGMLLRDGRTKAQMTEAEGLYLGWLLRELIRRDIPVAIVAYSFGARVTTGALHALAGGVLGGRQLSGDPVRGANLPVALLAPALEARWLDEGQHHGLAGHNIGRLAVFYNSRDAVLKRYRLIEPGSLTPALGFIGPRRPPSGVDGAPIAMTARNCASAMGLIHSEKEYYNRSCNAGASIAALFSDMLFLGSE